MFINCYTYLYLATGDKKIKNKIKLNDSELDIGFKCCIYIDYLMVGLRYGLYPRMTDVISRTSEVRASE